MSEWSISRGTHITDMWTARHCGEDAVLQDGMFVCVVCGRRLERLEAIGRHGRALLQRRSDERIEHDARHEEFVESRLSEMSHQVHSCPMCGADITDFTHESEGISGTCPSCQLPFFIGID